MYGYVVPFKPSLRQSDYVLYRAFYCGICCQTGKEYGQLPRFTTNYDFAFFSALLHDRAVADIVIEEHGCVLNPKKKAILQPNPLLERLAAANIMLAYQKAEDGVADGDGIKYGIVRHVLKCAYGKAKSAYPEIHSVVENAYSAQRAVEKNAIASVDRAADPFANLTAKLSDAILGVQTDDKFKGLCYNIGKFIYLADALDDIDDDFKRGRYNPFLATFGEFKGRIMFIRAHRAELEFCFGGICARAAAYLEQIKFNQSRSLIRNIVVEGLPKKANELLDSTEKLKPPRI